MINITRGATLKNKLHNTCIIMTGSVKKLNSSGWQLRKLRCIDISGGSRISRWGGADPLGGGANLQCIHFSAKTYAKTKEMDPVGGGRPLDPPMDMYIKTI